MSRPGSVSEICRLRGEVARVDRELQRALFRRLRLAVAIGRMKQDHGLPLRDHGVEEKVVMRWIQSLSGWGIPQRQAASLARWLIRESIRIQARRSRARSRTP